jgi:hypothetical protein
VFLGKNLVGEFPYDPGQHPKLRYRRSGVAYCCPECGDVWARILLLNSDGRPQQFEFQVVACERHKDQWEVPGSLLAAGEGILDLLPDQLVRREFELHLKKEGL